MRSVFVYAYNAPPQVATTLNIDCPTWLDWFHGGLQFQVEHHLWPRLPRHNLRRARDLVQAFCHAHKVCAVLMLRWLLPPALTLCHLLSTYFSSSSSFTFRLF